MASLTVLERSGHRPLRIASMAVLGGKEFTNVHSNQDFPRLEIIARWGQLPISKVLRSQRILNSKMLSLAVTSKYLTATSELSIKKSDEGS